MRRIRSSVHLFSFPFARRRIEVDTPLLFHLRGVGGFLIVLIVIHLHFMWDLITRRLCCYISRDIYHHYVKHDVGNYTGCSLIPRHILVAIASIWRGTLDDKSEVSEEG